jgi:hypothetical protein
MSDSHLHGGANAEFVATEDALWDKAVAAMLPEPVLSWLEHGRTGEQGEEQVSPLAQVWATLMIAQSLDQSRDDNLSSNAEILIRANEFYYRSDSASAFVADGETPLIWVPLAQLYLASLSPRFSNQISRALRRLSVHHFFQGAYRGHVENLLFHPLQNAWLHGQKVQGRKCGFGGVSIRVVDRIEPITPSTEIYRSELQFEGSLNFLEIIVHDDGAGIAAHYRNSRSPDTRSLLDLDPSIEWGWMRSAFERHSTSWFAKAQLDHHASTAFIEHGIGLSAMLAAARHLRAYLEVRCGRLRAYKFFQMGERAMKDHLILPLSSPPPAPPIPGTIIRCFVPLLPRT